MSIASGNIQWENCTTSVRPEDFLKMLVRARAVTAEALAQAERAANCSRLLQYQLQLANWDGLIGWMGRAAPLEKKASFSHQFR